MLNRLSDPIYLEERPKPFLDPGPKHDIHVQEDLGELMDPPDYPVEIIDMSDFQQTSDLGDFAVPEVDLLT